MFAKMKATLTLAVLSSTLIFGHTAPASAAMDVDNTEGRYNGHYKCVITVKRPNKENEEYDASMELDCRDITLHLKEGDVRTHYDTMVDYSYKTEIDAHDPKDKKVRYRVKIDGNIVP